ncbi:hypothetical protein LXL04_012640 [Taraxacum kok-saghyz]
MASSSNPPQLPKLTKGRQKIEMKKIDDEKKLKVCFSKRHTGLFKKANELCTLCGVEMAIILFSPTNKPFSFGHPSLQTVIHRFFQNQDPPAESSRTSELMQQYRDHRALELNTQFTNLQGQLEAAKKTGEELKKVRKARQEMFLWDAPLENLGEQELQKLKMAVLQLKKNAENQAYRNGGGVDGL